MPNEADFHILALSGGGFRGLYTATVLRCLEEALGAPLARRFDLICGTSAGGLIALGLADEVPARELQALFEDNRRRIFGSRGFFRRLVGGRLWVAKHSASGLRAVLDERFGNATIGQLKHRLVVPAVNCTLGRAQLFKTPHARMFHRDHTRTLVDVALATTAAPTYFPLHEIADEGTFADGGLVGNAPGLFGLHEAQHMLDVATCRVRVLSIGTMGLGAGLRGGESLDRGFLRWGARLFDLTVAAQETTANSMLSHWLRDRYYEIDDRSTPEQSKDLALDCVSDGAVEVLRARGSLAAKRALASLQFAPFAHHVAIAPTFFHGPNKTAEGTDAKPELIVQL